MLELAGTITGDRTCPLCGRPNECAMAQGRSVSVCWCTAVRVHREQLDPIPEEHRGVRCLCPAWLQALAAGGTNQGVTGMDPGEADRTAIEELTARWLAVERDRDVAVLLDLLTDDAVFLMPNGQAVTGKAVRRATQRGT